MKTKSGMRAAGAAFVGASLLVLAAPAASAPARPVATAAKRAPACEVRMEDVSFLRDQGLSVKLGAKLQFNKALLGEQISAKVSGGVAMLSGRVSAPDMVKAAAKIAAETEGIRCVQNFLEVGPPVPAAQPAGY